MKLSGNKNADLEILSNLNDRSLFNFCISDPKNMYIKKLCNDESFWLNRFIKKFGKEAIPYKPTGRTWKNHYLKVVFDLDDYSLDPWSFFDNLKWDFETEILYVKQPENIDVGIDYLEIKKSPENIRNNFWLLNLGKKIKLGFPIDRYDELKNIIREYNTETYFTPYKVLKIVKDFYHETLTKNELEEQQDIENPFAEAYTEKDAENGEIIRLDMLGRSNFQGFYYDEYDDVYIISFKIEF